MLQKLISLENNNYLSHLADLRKLNLQDFPDKELDAEIVLARNSIKSSVYAAVDFYLPLKIVGEKINEQLVENLEENYDSSLIYFRCSAFPTSKSSSPNAFAFIYRNLCRVAAGKRVSANSKLVLYRNLSLEELTLDSSLLNETMA